MPVLGAPSTFSGLVGDAGTESLSGSPSGAQFAALLSAMKGIVASPGSSLPTPEGFAGTIPDGADPSSLRAWIDAADSYLQSLGGFGSASPADPTGCESRQDESSGEIELTDEQPPVDLTWVTAAMAALLNHAAAPTESTSVKPGAQENVSIASEARAPALSAITSPEAQTAGGAPSVASYGPTNTVAISLPQPETETPSSAFQAVIPRAPLQRAQTAEPPSVFAPIVTPTQASAATIATPVVPARTGESSQPSVDASTDSSAIADGIAPLRDLSARRSASLDLPPDAHTARQQGSAPTNTRQEPATQPQAADAMDIAPPGTAASTSASVSPVISPPPGDSASTPIDGLVERVIIVPRETGAVPPTARLVTAEQAAEAPTDSNAVDSALTQQVASPAAAVAETPERAASAAVPLMSSAVHPEGTDAGATFGAGVAESVNTTSTLAQPGQTNGESNGRDQSDGSPRDTRQISRLSPVHRDVLAATDATAAMNQVAATARPEGVERTIPREMSMWLHTPMLVQITSAIEAAAQRPGQTIHMQLHPEGLGSVSLNVGLTDGGVSVNIAVDNPATRDLVQSNWPQLTRTLEEHGLSVTGGQVQMQNGQGGTAQEQRQQAGSRTPFPLLTSSSSPEPVQSTPLPGLNLNSRRLDVRV